MPWRLLQYKEVFDAFWAECDDAMKDAIRPRLAQIQIKGNLCRAPVSEPLDFDLFEVKARIRRVRIRLLYGFLPNREVVFVWCGTKDQRRLRPATIRQAGDLLIEARAFREACDVVNFN